MRECRICGRPVTGSDTVEARGGLYHEACFEAHAGDYDDFTDPGIPVPGM